MKKKIDTMTAISILLIVINLVLFWAATVNRGSCEPEFVNGASILNFGQLFSSTVYAMAIQPTVMPLNGVIRNDIRYCTNDNFFLVSNINNISTNKVL